MKIFRQRDESTQKAASAVDFMKKYRRTILDSVAFYTGERKFIINDMLQTLIKRCREYKLCAPGEEPVTVSQIVAYITTRIMNYVHTGQFKGRKHEEKT